MIHRRPFRVLEGCELSRGKKYLKRSLRDHRSAVLRVLSTCAVLSYCFASPVNAAETRSWVVSWFFTAMHSEKGDCPQGLNPPMEEVYRGILKDMGKGLAEIENVIGGRGLDGNYPLADLIIYRGRVDGKPVNVYQYPESVPDPKLHLAQGKYAHGFNLDGKTAAVAYEDPDTGEKGIDHQVARALGCTQVYRATPPDRSLQGGAFQWDTVRSSMPAWLVSVTGEDLSKDGDVTVVFDRALNYARTDALGGTMADLTYKVDQDPRSHNVFKGRIEKGRITIAPGNFYMLSDPYYMSRFDVRDAQMRLQIAQDGNLSGFIGGYQPWIDIYWKDGVTGWHLEPNVGSNFVGLYHALKKLADAYPDPKSGQNTRISVTYQLDAVPAFVLRPEAAAKGVAQAETKH